MADVLGFTCEVCGEEFPDSLPDICRYCHMAVCDSCMHGQGDEGQGHELAEHVNEITHAQGRRRGGSWEYDDVDFQ